MWGSQGVLAHQPAHNPQQTVLWPHAGLVPGFTALGGCCRYVLLIRIDDGFVKFRVRPSALPTLPRQVPAVQQLMLDLGHRE